MTGALDLRTAALRRAVAAMALVALAHQTTTVAWARCAPWSGEELAQSAGGLAHAGHDARGTPQDPGVPGAGQGPGDDDSSPIGECVIGAGCLMAALLSPLTTSLAPALPDDVFVQTSAGFVAHDIAPATPPPRG